MKPEVFKITVLLVLLVVIVVAVQQSKINRLEEKLAETKTKGILPLKV
jgi:hypothetical protein